MKGARLERLKATLRRVFLRDPWGNWSNIWLRRPAVPVGFRTPFRGLVIKGRVWMGVPRAWRGGTGQSPSPSTSMFTVTCPSRWYRTGW